MFVFSMSLDTLKYCINNWNKESKRKNQKGIVFNLSNFFPYFNWYKRDNPLQEEH